MRKLVIIGDHFMRSDMFEKAIRQKCPKAELDITAYDLAWPDEPMEVDRNRDVERGGLRRDHGSGESLRGDR